MNLKRNFKALDSIENIQILPINEDEYKVRKKRLIFDFN